jgi:hypothetical protein
MRNKGWLLDIMKEAKADVDKWPGWMRDQAETRLVRPETVVPTTVTETSGTTNAPAPSAKTSRKK